jgi:RNA polymerase sigma-70 factor (ECF subfamily)
MEIAAHPVAWSSGPILAGRERCDEAEAQLIVLMEEYERQLYTFLLSLLGDADVAADCAQDTFLRAYEHLYRGRPVNGGWLYRVARNRAMDEFRRKRYVQPGGEEIERGSAPDGIELGVTVRQVMEQLPPQYREVLYLFSIAGFKTDEIGAMLGIRGSAVRQRLYRAREHFRLLYLGAESCNQSR